MRMRAWFQDLPFENSIILEQAKLLQWLLLGLLGILGLIFLLAFAFLGTAAVDVTMLGPLFALTLFTVIALRMLRRGAYVTAAVLILVVILTSQIRSLIDNGLTENTFVFLGFTIPILFAGLTISRTAMFATFGIVTIFVGAVIYADRPYEFNDQEFAGYLLVMGFFLFVVDRFGISLHKTFKTAEEQRQQLAVERERLQVTLASIGDAVIATDVHGAISFMNAVAEQVTGWRADEAAGQPLSRVFNIINEDTRQLVESPYTKVIRTGAIVGLANHTVLIRKDGEEIPIDDSGAPIRDNTGIMMGIILVFRDISARRLVEKNEEEHQRLVDTLLETTQTINSSFDLEEVVEFILETLQRILPTDFSYIMLLRPARILKTRGYEEHGDKFQKAFTELSDPVRKLSRLRLMEQTREPLLVSDTRERKDWLEFPPGEPLPSFLGVPIVDHEEVIGFIGLHSTSADYFQSDQARRLEFFATQIGIVIHNTLLVQKEQELAILEERQRLARDLHDSVTQMLFASSVIAKTLPQMVTDMPEAVLEQLKKLQRFNQGALADMRRLLIELRQTDVASIPLPELIQQLATAIMGNSMVDIHLNTMGESELPPDIHATFYKISQEALNNIVKHANASRVDIQLDLQPDSASLVIKDDGEGFDPAEIRSTHMGLKIMHERADADEAELKISSKPGEGTELRLSWTQ